MTCRPSDSNLSKSLAAPIPCFQRDLRLRP